MKILELFAGSRSFSKVAEELGHEVYTTDAEPFEKIDQVCHINLFDELQMFDEFGKPDIIWASVPCQTFSVASIGHHWKGGNKAYIPKTKRAEEGIWLVDYTIWLIHFIKPKYFYIENPRGLLRKLPVITENRFMPKHTRHTVWYCQYFNEKKYTIKRAKPTDIWTNDMNWNPRPVCKNGNPDCDHEKAPRGSRTGTQGLKNDYERSKVPYELCKEILEGIKL